MFALHGASFWTDSEVVPKVFDNYSPEPFRSNLQVSAGKDRPCLASVSPPLSEAGEIRLNMGKLAVTSAGRVSPHLPGSRRELTPTLMRWAVFDECWGKFEVLARRPSLRRVVFEQVRVISCRICGPAWGVCLRQTHSLGIW